MLTGAEFIQQLSRSEIYRDYERAFGDATALPVTLRPLELPRPAQHGRPHENPFHRRSTGRPTDPGTGRRRAAREHLALLQTF